MNTPLLIAHRGDTINFPENTLKAFESAFSQGADGIELDVQLGQEQLIVVHNYQFDEKADYPTLKSVLASFGDKGRIEIEVKSFSTNLIEPLQLLLSDYHSIDLELTTSVQPLVRPLVEAFPGVQVGFIFDQCQFQAWMENNFILREISELMELTQAQVAHISSLPMEKLTQNLVDALHARQLKVHYHILKKPMAEQVQLYQRLAELGVDQATFDDSHLLKEV